MSLCYVVCRLGGVAPRADSSVLCTCRWCVVFLRHAGDSGISGSPIGEWVGHKNTSPKTALGVESRGEVLREKVRSMSDTCSHEWCFWFWWVICHHFIECLSPLALFAFVERGPQPNRRGHEGVTPHVTFAV